MKIVSADTQSELVIDSFEDEHGYISYSLSAKIDLGHSEFKGKNSDVTFLNMPEFINDLDEFVLNRKIEPKLNGTYGSELLFKGTARYVSISFNIGSAFCGAETYNYNIKGTFEVAQESLIETIRELRKNA